MTESQILTLNERLKTMAGYFSNLSAALMAAAVARMWVRGDGDFTAFAWAAGAMVLLWLAWSLLYLLEPAYEG
jgi:hypothetical protein